MTAVLGPIVWACVKKLNIFLRLSVLCRVEIFMTENGANLEMKMMRGFCRKTTVMKANEMIMRTSQMKLDVTTGHIKRFTVGRTEKLELVRAENFTVDRRTIPRRIDCPSTVKTSRKATDNERTCLSRTDRQAFTKAWTDATCRKMETDSLRLISVADTLALESEPSQKIQCNQCYSFGQW